MSHSENFVGHTSVQEVFDVIWSGETAHKVKTKKANSEVIECFFYLDQRQTF